MSKPRGRQQTQLEILARDHNWRQGSLRRLYVNCEIIRDPEDQAAARSLVQKEIDRTQAEFESAKKELR